MEMVGAKEDCLYSEQRRPRTASLLVIELMTLLHHDEARSTGVNLQLPDKGEPVKQLSSI